MTPHARTSGPRIPRLRVLGLAVALVMAATACTTTSVSTNDIVGPCNAQGTGGHTKCVSTGGPDLRPGPAPARVSAAHEPPGTVKIAAGSEDVPFLEDPQVVRELKHDGLTVNVTAFGSGQLANNLPSDGYDAFLLSSQVFTAMAEKRFGPRAEYVPFSTQLSVFTWKDLVPVLTRAGLINGAGQFSVEKYIQLVKSETAWTRLRGNTSYHNPNQILMNMSDPAKSDSGAMFVAAAAYKDYTVLLHHRAMSYQQDMVTAVTPDVTALINAQGSMQSTSYLVYLDYRREGEGLPMALGYTSEVTGKQSPETGPLPKDAVSYPLDAPVACDHIVFPFSKSGEMLGAALSNDPVLQKLAQQYGFVTTGPPSQETMDIQVPTAAILQKLIDDVDPNG